MSINNNNSTNNANYDLPPIRKIGPAVLPKPKNIKIQAGRGKKIIFYLHLLEACFFFEFDFSNSNTIESF
jgi:hypothetical protein